MLISVKEEQFYHIDYIYKVKIVHSKKQYGQF